MTLGSYVNGPNNTICREWDGKAGPWSLGNGQSGFSWMPIRRWIWLVQLSLTLMWFKRFDSLELVRGALPSHHSSSLFLQDPLLPCSLSLLYQYLPPVLHLRVSFSLFGAIIRPINLHVRVVGKSWIAWQGVWVCQVLGSTLWYWQLSCLYCSCTEFVLFFGRFVRC